MTIEELKAAAKSMIDRLMQGRADDTPDEAKKLIGELRDQRQFGPLVELAKVYNATAPYDAETATWLAQGLIEVGKAEDARVLLVDIAAKALATPPRAYIEAKGLLGRSWKQTFFDAADKSGGHAKEAISNSLKEYKAGYDAEPDGSGWAAVNLLALADFARRYGIAIAADIEARALALKVLTALDRTPIGKRDNWYHATRAEAYLAMGDLDAVEMHIGAFVRDTKTTAFALGGTLRQFTELWQLDQQGERGHGIVEALRAALLAKEGGRLEMSSDQVRQSLDAQRPLDSQLQKILGAGGLVKYDWLLKGLTTAQSVGVISHAGSGRMGTGFLIRGGDIMPALGDEMIVVTNSHVISDPPEASAIAFSDAIIAFEAVDSKRIYEFAGVLWNSPIANLDCTLLRLKEQPAGIKPLAIAANIAPIPKTDAEARPRVYVIGYPGGRDLAFSIQDNDLLDHEAPPDGTPRDPNACFVQYRAPTEPGSSGSPVFEAALWRVIALHHAGAEAMRKLNGKPGTWAANEGIWIQSIVKAAASANIKPTPAI
jgi:V8-like Glu-specific endopeptidase